jgi:hypothetical protein
MRRDVEACLTNARLLQRLLEDGGVATMLNRLSSTVVFERPPEEAFVRKWQLACEGEHGGGVGRWRGARDRGAPTLPAPPPLFQATSRTSS